VKKFCLLMLIVFIPVCATADIVLSALLKIETGEQQGLKAALPKPENRDILKSIEDLSALRIPAVRDWVYYYATRGRSYFIASVKNSQLYRPIIEEVILYDYPDMPLVIADLPILESSYTPYAVSRAGAVGLWQFMPKTAQMLDLSINTWEDGRRSLIPSTHAALKHLNHLYRHHHSWELALAAYNCGSSRVNRAVSLYPELSYWELVETGVLPVETSLYVQKYAALSLLYRHSRLYGLPSNPEEIIEVSNFDLKKPVSITHVANTVGIPESIIYLLNPQLKMKTTPLIESGYSLLIPVNYSETFYRKEDSLYTIPFSRVKTHKVSSGEYLSKIAKKYNIPMQQLIKLNNLKKPYLLKPGNKLLIPIQ
jgi:membrane-bound lytic murein transglycosylase D